MASPALPALEPEELLSDLLGLDPGLRREIYYGERSIFFNPGGVAPLGTIFASVKERDGPNDKAAKLARQGVYRLAFCLTPGRFAECFGQPPRSHYESLKPLLAESLEVVKAKWTQRTAG
jgi:hypothetical protein